MSEGRIYDDIFPLNVSGRYCCDLTWMVKDKLDKLYPEGWEANSHLLLITNEGYPYIGQWHRDAPPYWDDSIVMICLSGYDEIGYSGPGFHANLKPGESFIFPAGLIHRGNCSTHRITYHCRVGPKGKIMPESPPDALPPMTLRRFLGRLWRTLRYHVRQSL